MAARQSESLENVSDDMGKLKDDIAALRADLSSLTKSMKSMGNSAVGDLQALGAEKFDELRAELERTSGEVRQKGEASVAEIERAVRERPLMSLLAAFGAGMLITRLMDRG